MVAILSEWVIIYSVPEGSVLFDKLKDFVLVVVSETNRDGLFKIKAR